ncbi:flagellar basal body rod protein FlgB [Herbaspirillum sp. RV1423]|uniref:flagellar basal body rod protein FlgB n=1 Tax=Herbaspirillum sp. RV1423 TaxID=1443993 RepID=UPI0004B3F47E|nr:flagellar basal body rod protein FlgB [Herbaspirillum sp. RV1423]
MVAKLDDYLRFNETALNLRAQRQQLLASNIANADTPNYKARDIDFAKTLQGAMQGKSTTVPPVELARTSPGHIAGKASGEEGIGGSPLLYRTVTQGSVDGNTVDMDVERNQFTDNAVRYEAGVTAVNAQIKGLLAAIQPG